MGVRGLTTFIQHEAEHFMTEYKLYDSVVIIDGPAILCHLYDNLKKRNDAFGGDYDRCGKVTYEFFDILSACGITPYLVFRGCMDPEDLPEKCKSKGRTISSLENLESMNCDRSRSIIYPVLWQATFMSIAREMQVKMISCTFDYTLECANLGRALNCPVLSNNSDFYLYDVLFVPLSTTKLKICSQDPLMYISCKTYSLDRFINHFEGLDRTKMPLLAVIVGMYHSDNVDASHLSRLLAQDVEQSNNHNKIEQVISWLQRYDTDSIIAKIVDHSDSTRKKRLQDTISHAYKTYTCRNSQYLKYLGKEDSVSTVQDSSMQQYIVDDDGTSENSISAYFLENFKNGLYTSASIDIAMNNIHCCFTQVEDLTTDGAYKASLDIVAAVHKILNKEHRPLTCYGRTQGTRCEIFQIPMTDKDLPYVDEIQHMDLSSKYKIIVSALNFHEATFNYVLNNFPDSWNLFILAIKYWKNKTQPPRELVVALVLCKVILGHIGNQIGLYCSSIELEKKYPTVEATAKPTVTSDINMSLTNIPTGEGVKCLDFAIDFFILQTRFRTGLDRKLIHRISEFQACLVHLICLDELLESPLEIPLASECMNCTFIYQLTQHLSRAPNYYDSLQILLMYTPVIYNIVVKIIKKIDGMEDH